MAESKRRRTEYERDRELNGEQPEEIIASLREQVAARDRSIASLKQRLETEEDLTRQLYEELEKHEGDPSG